MEKGKYTIEKSTVECYKIRHESGMYWADITVDSMGNKGRISISSDFGNYANFWGACGHSFKEFLTELNLYYAADKFGADKWFDLDKTINGYKQRVLEQRRNDEINEVFAREIWDEIKELDQSSSKGEFEGMIWNSPKILSFFDHCPEMNYGITPQFKRLWSTVWQIFIETIKLEISQSK